MMDSMPLANELADALRRALGMDLVEPEAKTLDTILGLALTTDDDISTLVVRVLRVSSAQGPVDDAVLLMPVDWPEELASHELAAVTQKIVQHCRQVDNDADRQRCGFATLVAAMQRLRDDSVLAPTTILMVESTDPCPQTLGLAFDALQTLNPSPDLRERAKPYYRPVGD